MPASSTVREVVVAGGGLLAWEELCKKLKGRPGVVVDHVGGGMGSHYSIHCVLNEIPVVFSHHPYVGECLKSLDSSIKTPISETDFYEGFHASLACKELPVREHLLLALVVLHNFTAFEVSKDESFLLGTAIAGYIKASAVVSCGELRHCNYSRFKSVIDNLVKE